MAKLIWHGGSPERLEARIRTTEDRLRPMALEIVQETVQIGREKQIEALNAATTPYGEKRYAAGRGGSAGRNDTGNMIDLVTTTAEETASGAIGTWGWENPPDYVLAQEHRIGADGGADSLWKSFVPTREEFYRKVLAAAKGRR